MKRRFNRSERFVLFTLSGGKCALCGRPLGRKWHADHIHPHSKGGETDVINGQALCPKCNLKKGASMIELREWQKDQHEKFLKHSERWFMLVATPGAGKTTAMLNNAAEMMRTKQCHKVLVVAPSVELKHQWKTSARRGFGLQLLDKYDGYLDDLTFQGAIVTYQQIAMSPQQVRGFFANRRVFVILDEPHHMGDKNEWGNAARYALEHTWRGVMGSGTPFRTDKYPIPFVQYDANGRLEIHDRYSYAQALVDEVVRAIFFRKFNIDAKWMSYDDEIVTASFDDPLPERKQTERLNLTLQFDSEWIQATLKQAINDIRHIRQTEQPDAALLIVAKDTIHATQLAECYEAIAGKPPIVVSSADDHEGVEAIERFRKSKDECIVSVDMVSEGVDIPRLRSLVYATNKITQLKFEQIIGRVVRVQPGFELANALVYIPSDPRLLAFADQIKRERDYVIDAMERRERINPGSSSVVNPFKKFPPLEVLHLQAIPDGGMYMDEEFTEADLEAARKWKRDRGYRIPLEEAARIMRHEVQMAVSKTAVAVTDIDPQAEMEKLRKACNRYAFSAAAQLGVEVKEIHKKWVFEHGGSWQKSAPLEELERKLLWLRGL